MPQLLLHLENCLRRFSWTSWRLPNYWWLANKVCRVCMFFLFSLCSHTGFPLCVHEKNANQASLTPKVAPRNVCLGSPWLMDCEACLPAISSTQSGSPWFWNLQTCSRRRIRHKQWRQGSMSGVWDVWRNTDSAVSEPLFSGIFCIFFLCVFSKGVFFPPSPKLNENRRHNHCRALIQYIKMAQGTIHKLCNLNSIFPQSKVKMLLWMRALYLVEHNNLWRQTPSKNGHLLFTFYRFFFFF